MKKVRVEEAAGLILAHDVTEIIPGKKKDVAFKRGTVIRKEDVDRLLDFFRYFTNSCHEPKEEDLLFTALHRRGLAWEGYPLRKDYVIPE